MDLQQYFVLHYMLFKNRNNTPTMRGRIAKSLNISLTISIFDSLIFNFITSDVIFHDMYDIISITDTIID